MKNKKVMICGSRSIKQLTESEIAVLHSIIKLELNIIIGDANGVDVAVQDFLARSGYRKVQVYSTLNLRNNIGKWPVAKIHGNYTYRDEIMCSRADWLFAIWDGVSPGTKRNIESFTPEKVRVSQRG